MSRPRARGEPALIPAEADLQRTIIEAARLHGFRVAHFRPARTEKGWRTPLEGDAGFPDLILALDGSVLAWELKGERGRLTAEQEAWRDALGNLAGGTIDYDLVRPHTLDRALAVLERIARGGLP